MSSRTPFTDKDADLNHTLYRYGLSLAVIFDLLVEKGLFTREEIQAKSRSLNQHLLTEEPWPPSR